MLLAVGISAPPSRHRQRLSSLADSSLRVYILTKQTQRPGPPAGAISFTVGSGVPDDDTTCLQEAACWSGELIAMIGWRVGYAGSAKREPDGATQRGPPALAEGIGGQVGPGHARKPPISVTRNSS
jgi:hypothetical protein